MAHDALVCRSCGNLVSECSDPSIDWHAHVSTCYATATTQWGLRRLRDKHADEKHYPHALHPLEGAAVFASRSAPEGEDPLA